MVGLLETIPFSQAGDQNRKLSSLRLKNSTPNHPTLFWNPKDFQSDLSLLSPVQNPSARWDLLSGQLKIENKALNSPWAPRVRNFLNINRY